MIEIDIPGGDRLNIEHIVLDYNGTMAVDGRVLDGVFELLYALAPSVALHVVTADTFGQARQQLLGLPCVVTVLPPGDQDQAKRDYVRQLGADRTAAIGNGRNDRLMLQEAALGIALVQAEGAAVQTLLAAGLVCRDVVDALALFTNPRRLAATLRS